MKTPIVALAASVFTFLPMNAVALEAPQTFRADYRLSFLGFEIARSTFVSNFSGNTFVLNGSLKSTGLAAMFDKTVAHTHVTGRIADDGVEPLDYQLNYVMGGKRQKTAIRFEEGNVVETENIPPLKKRGAKWVPLDADDLSAVFDPLTASMVRANSAREVCNRTIKAYDGEMRLNLKLQYAGTKPFKTIGFKGNVVRCKAKFKPVSGYRKGRRALEFMKHESRMEIAFAQVGSSNIFAPITASVGTQVGTLHLHAVRFATSN